jgi:hypothetical protein
MDALMNYGLHSEIRMRRLVVKVCSSQLYKYCEYPLYSVTTCTLIPLYTPNVILTQSKCRIE